MTGKDKCEFLKEIRKNMAKENGLSYEPRECHHEGYCTGTCPLCEKEAAELLEELKKKEKNGENIQIDSEAIQVLEQIAERPEEIDNEEEEIELLGDIPPGYFEAHPLSEKERELEEQRLVREEAERQMRIKVSQKSGIWNKIKKKIRDCFTPTIMGEFYDEDEVREYTQDDETPFMGIIVHEPMMHKEPEPEPEPEPDIVWNLDGEEETVISPSANIVDNENRTANPVDNDVFSLSRFLRAQEYESGGYKDALQEVKNGCKRKHWIWYIFPQINGLGHSDYQEYYGIKSLEEARAYLDNKILGARLREITEALLQLEDKSTLEIFGSTDSMKVKSCMTLFDIVAPHDIFEKVLDKYYNGKRCELTLRRFGQL